MPDNPSLLRQLTNRAKRLHQHTNVSQSSMANAIGITDGNYSCFLKRRRGLSTESTCLLLQFVNMPVQEVVAKFCKSTLSSKILRLQENGKQMRLSNDGWVAGQSGMDVKYRCWSIHHRCTFCSPQRCRLLGRDAGYAELPECSPSKGYRCHSEFHPKG
jgi:hypothetical protein